MTKCWKTEACVFLMQVICSLCDHEQDVKQVCEKCGVCMGDYYCDKCKFFDDEVSIFSYPNTKF
jgi:hypothetical protein